eukprot:CAMPEP_0177602334 /NCGR_PEP_ID=MMETSP0419_2-20121207/14799_1 /TAXON_ID=582737 /ORGANISM="Tetraselmis sp., Strain GSL018" /LENGTH=87 /DNA_ID=CAMNT_0019095783 /DNA_START=542 /DNA_END=806 /DNA_ORIENTATION=+
MDEKTVEEFLQADVELLKQRILRRGDVICQLLRSEASEALQSMDLNGGDAAGNNGQSMALCGPEPCATPVDLDQAEFPARDIHDWVG